MFQPWQRWTAVAIFGLAMASSLFCGHARAQEAVLPVTFDREVELLDRAARATDYRTEKKVTLSAMVIAAVLDEGTTAWCLGARRCYEKNAVLSWAVTESGALFALTKGAGTLATLLIVDWLYDAGHPKLARAVGWIATGSWTAAGARNAVQNARRVQ